ncbi:MAG TPA: hypothetical protein VFS21_29750 [Roseiflexaceae bacterium]|nr:hypothetical protein [Roseiflexaceae bacterium]
MSPQNQPRQARTASPSGDLGASPGDLVAWFRRAFLRARPQRHALMTDPAVAQATGRKYHERSSSIHSTQIRAHLAGRLTLAAPAAVDGRACLLPLDLDTGGLPALLALLDQAAQRGLWAFGQFCPRPGWAEADQRGYIWLPFDQLVPAAQLQLLGEQLIQAVARPGWSIEARTHAGVTRLPLGRHRHTGRFGDLLLPDRTLPIDHDPRAALEALRAVWRPNPAAALPPLPAARPVPAQRPVAPLRRAEGTSNPGITIAAYNQATDLPALLLSYGARWAGRRLLHCPAHADQRRASLLLIQRRGSDELLCRCLSQHSGCVLAGAVRDAFGVYCALERLTPAEALRKLNGRD